MLKVKQNLLCVFVATAFLIHLFFPVYAENTVWDCPNCGRTGNTGKYCGSCAHSAPWPEESVTPSSNVFWFNFSEDDLYEKADSLFEEAARWSKETCPQTIDSFSLLPVGLIEQYNSIRNAGSKLYNNGTQYIWETNVESFFPDNCEWGSTFLQYDENGVCGNKDFDIIANGVYAIPEGVSEKDIQGFGVYRDLDLGYYAVSYSYTNEFLGKYENINRFIDVVVILQDKPNQRNIMWATGKNRQTRKEYLGISLTSNSGCDCHLTYDIQTRKLLSIKLYWGE